MKKLIFGICAGSLSILLPANVFAAQCTNYKFDQLGVKIFDTDQGPKIVSTGQASVLIDDIDEVNDAFEEAKLTAKKKLSNFIMVMVYKMNVIMAKVKCPLDFLQKILMGNQEPTVKRLQKRYFVILEHLLQV